MRFGTFLDGFSVTQEMVKEEPRLVTLEADASMFAYTAVGLR